MKGYYTPQRGGEKYPLINIMNDFPTSASRLRQQAKRVRWLRGKEKDGGEVEVGVKQRHYEQRSDWLVSVDFFIFYSNVYFQRF